MIFSKGMSGDKMSIMYDKYLKNHRDAVILAYSWIVNYLNENDLQIILPNLNSKKLKKKIMDHDDSKYSHKEYFAYDEYFYGNGKNTAEGINNFNKAWLHHIHNNPHHWQYWVLIEDNNSTPKPLDIPDNYIIEMVSDWWSFSWREYISSEDVDSTISYMKLYNIFNWYDDHKDKMILTDSTRMKIEQLLSNIRSVLDNSKIPLSATPMQ